MLDLTNVFASFPVLETERLILRTSTPADALDIFHFMSDLRAMKYLVRPLMASVDEALQRIQMFQTLFREQNAVPWVVEGRAADKVIGTCVIQNLVRLHHRAEIGYMLSPEWWGQGLATEAVTAVLNFAFAQMGMHSLEARTDPDNAASQKLLGKLGFVQEGYFREDYYDEVGGKFVDTTVFSLVKGTWERHAGG